MLLLFVQQTLAEDPKCSDSTTIQLTDKPTMHFTGNAQVDFFNVTGYERKDALEKFNTIFQQPTESGNEKSPWIAGLLSLAVPGAGEWYADSKTKAVIFFGIEVASWVTAYIYNKKGDHQTDMFQNYANQHYRASAYANYSLSHIGELNPLASDSLTYAALIYPGGNSGCGPPFDCMNWTELNIFENKIMEYGNNGYSHQMPRYGDQQYFELIGKYPQFFSGWDEFDWNTPPSAIADGYNFTFAQQRLYADMRTQANNNYDIAGTFVGIAVINHVVSALDAYLTATNYNNAFHAKVDMHLQETPLGLIPVTEVKVTHTF